VLVVSSLLFLRACGHKEKIKIIRKSLVALIPLGFQRVNGEIYSTLNNLLFIETYSGKRSFDCTITFYRHEFEADEWDMSGFSTNEEGLFFCCREKNVRWLRRGSMIIEIILAVLFFLFVIVTSALIFFVLIFFIGKFFNVTIAQDSMLSSFFNQLRKY
jgi:hypothetical protein